MNEEEKKFTIGNSASKLSDLYPSPECLKTNTDKMLEELKEIHNTAGNVRCNGGNPTVDCLIELLEALTEYLRAEQKNEIGKYND